MQMTAKPLFIALCSFVAITIYLFSRRTIVKQIEYLQPINANLTITNVCSVLAVGPRLVGGVSGLCTYQGHLTEGACKPVMDCGAHFGDLTVALWTDPSVAEYMDIIVAASDDAAVQPPRVWPNAKPAWQVRVLVGFENPDTYPGSMYHLRAAWRKEKKLHHLSYGLVPEHNDLVINNVPPEADLLALQKRKWSFERKEFMACYISDTQRTERIGYITALNMALRDHKLEVHYYGPFMHNRDEPEEGDYSSRFGRKISVLRKYRFTLTFESQRRPFYLTEKLYNTLQAGSLPVYWGAPNITDYVPQNSFIDASSVTPQQLAKQIVYLNSNSSAYASYFSWKAKPLSISLTDRSWESSHWTLCRACRYYLEEWPMRGHSLQRRSAWDPLLT